MNGYLRLAALAAPLVMVACARDDLSVTQDRTCTAAIANQIGQPADTLLGIREGATPAGEAVYLIRTPEVNYRCTIDDRLNVVNITSEQVSD